MRRAERARAQRAKPSAGPGPRPRALCRGRRLSSMNFPSCLAVPVLQHAPACSSTTLPSPPACRGARSSSSLLPATSTTSCPSPPTTRPCRPPPPRPTSIDAEMSGNGYYSIPRSAVLRSAPLTRPLSPRSLLFFVPLLFLSLQTLSILSRTGPRPWDWCVVVYRLAV